MWRRGRLIAVLFVLALVSADLPGVLGFSTDRASATTPIRILPLGDSITEGRSNSQLSPTYRFYLWELLEGAGANVDFVGSRFGVQDSGNLPSGTFDPGGDWDKDHEGHQGWTADNLLNGLHAGDGNITEWMTDFNPDIVLLHAGTNDIAITGDSDTQILADLTALINEIRVQNPNVTIVMSNLIGSANPTWNARINSLNPKLPGLASSLSTAQSPILFSDANAGFNINTMLVDNLHPNPLGQRHLADAFGETLLENGLVTNTPATSSCSVSEEAENGTFTGNMQIINNGSASGGQMIGNIAMSGNSTTDPSNVLGTLSVCLQAQAAGQYRVDLDVFGATNSQNSFFYSVDASNFGIYDYPAGPTITVNDPLEDRGGADPLLINLTAGDHNFNFLSREGGSAIDRITLVPLDVNLPPTANFTISCDGTTCGFDGSSSSDDDGTVDTYAWDFGDGNTATGAVANNAFAGSGSFTVTLTVTDDDGATAQLTQQIDVLDPNDPVADFTVICNLLSCDFDGSGSIDNGTIDTYAWDFGDTNLGAGVGPTNVYTDTGAFVVSLTVTDDEGITGTTEQTINVSGNLVCTANSAEFENGAWTGTVDVLNRSDASGGLLLRTLEGSGNDLDPENLSVGSAEVCISVASAGDYTANVDVVAPGNASDSWWVSINGAPATAFVAAVDGNNISTDELNSVVDGEILDPAILQLAEGDNVLKFYVREDGSSLDRITVVPVADPNIPIASFTSACTDLGCEFDASASSDNSAIQSYEWDFGDGSSNGSGQTTTHDYTTPGTFNVTLTVTDDEGLTASATDIVTVLAPLVCGVGSVELESGNLAGNVVESPVAGASGGLVVGSPQASGSDTAGNLDEGSVEVCVTVETAGNFTVDVDLISPDTGSDSWHYSVNDGQVEIFTTPISSSIITDQLNVFGGADPLELALDAGDHDFKFYVRDDGASLDRLTLVPIIDPNIPTASFTSSCTDLGCDFDASGSSDNSAIATYAWDFGDGSPTGSGQTPTHTYPDTGTFDVTLTVTDDEGLIASFTDSVSVIAPLVCDVNSVEFESGVLSGNVITSSFTGASGDLVARSLPGSGNDMGGNLTRGAVEVCVAVAEAGTFTVDIDLASPTGGSNSWWYSLNGSPVTLFSTAVSSSIITDQLSDATSDPAEVELDAGNHFFTFHIREAGASLDRLTLTPVADPNIPIASFASSCTGLGCEFDASCSSDNSAIATYDWDFGDLTTGTGETVTHDYVEPGSYNVSLTVTDDEGLTASTNQVIDVFAPLVCSAGSAEFEAGNLSGTLAVASEVAASGGQVVQSPQGSGGDNAGALTVGSVTVCVTVDADDIYTVDVGLISPDGSSNSWWYEVNDGPVDRFDTDITTVVATDQLNDLVDGVDPVVLDLTAGDHFFTFYVREDGGSLDNLTLVRASNEAPIPAFTFSCTDLDCSFDGSTSSDDQSIDSYVWDFGDLTADVGVTSTHLYGASGTFDVTLTVTDNEGLSASTTQSISVVDPTAPIADFTFTCDSVNCDFDGSTSSSPTGDVVSYVWDFDNGNSAVGETVTQAFPGTGTSTSA